MLKPSHYRTPREISECWFTTGYRSAEPSGFAELGHWVLNVCTVVGIVVLIPLVVMGVV